MYLKLVFVITAVSIALLFSYNKEKQKAATPDDIHIKATLKLNENERMSHHDYMLEVVISKTKDSSHKVDISAVDSFK